MHRALVSMEENKHKDSGCSMHPTPVGRSSRSLFPPFVWQQKFTGDSMKKRIRVQEREHPFGWLREVWYELMAYNRTLVFMVGYSYFQRRSFVLFTGWLGLKNCIALIKASLLIADRRYFRRVLIFADLVASNLHGKKWGGGCHQYGGNISLWIIW